jgi:pantoate--beta-alanine ligase
VSIDSFTQVADLRSFLGAARREGKIVGLVPTMGALHDGHGTLMERARTECDIVVVSIFVNPTQFGPGEDLARYPRDLAADLLFCEIKRVDVVFAPTEKALYPAPLQTFVLPGTEASGLCGESRSGHFRGVATIVLKLFNAVGPDRAYFGEKDFQQLRVISRMVQDLNVAVEIVACPTHREGDGLAVSSRNILLNSEERRVATVLYRALRVARERIQDGDIDAQVALEASRTVVDLEPLAKIDYLEIVDPDTMGPVERIESPVRVVGAVWIGETRLIDNVSCDPPKKLRRGPKSRRPSATD